MRYKDELLDLVIHHLTTVGETDKIRKLLDYRAATNEQREEIITNSIKRIKERYDAAE